MFWDKCWRETGVTYAMAIQYLKYSFEFCTFNPWVTSSLKPIIKFYHDSESTLMMNVMMNRTSNSWSERFSSCGRTGAESFSGPRGRPKLQPLACLHRLTWVPRCTCRLAIPCYARTCNPGHNECIVITGLLKKIVVMSQTPKHKKKKSPVRNNIRIDHFSTGLHTNKDAK